MTAADEWLRIESLDLEAQGVAHNGEGKVVFVEDALPGEEVRVAVKRRKNNWEQAALVELRDESAQRVVPRCRHFGVCGGCKMQHLDVAAQVATKQRALEDALWHLGKVRPERMLRPMHGPAWGYRQRARFSVRHVAKKGTVLVGFHERKSSFVAEISSCEVVPRHVSDLLLPLRALSRRWPAATACRRSSSRSATACTALVLRHLEPLVDADLALAARVRRAARHRVVAAAEGPRDGAAARRRRLGAVVRAARVRPAHAVQADRLHAGQPSDQRGAGGARAAPARAAPRRASSSTGSAASATSPCRSRPARARVLGIEGSAALVERPRAAAALNGLAGKATFAVRNLFEVTRRRPGRVRQRRQVADRPAARGRVRDRQGARRALRGGHAGRRVAAARPHRLRQLQSGDAGARRRPAGASGRLPLQRRRRRQHVPAHGARREHRGVRSVGRLTNGAGKGKRGPQAPFRCR